MFFGTMNIRETGNIVSGYSLWKNMRNMIQNMRVRDLVNRYLHTSSSKIFFESMTRVFFNPLTQGVQECYPDDIETEMKETE